MNRKYKYVIGVFSLIVIAHVKADVILSNPTPDFSKNMAVCQTNQDGNLQTRWTSGDNRSVTQTFQWKSEDLLDGIGLYMMSSQTTWVRDQEYVLIIQEASGATGSAGTVVTNITFTMTRNNVSANQWLFIDFDNVALTSNQWYGITICPSSNDVAGTVMFWGSYSVDSSLPGTAQQFNPGDTGLPKSEFGSSNRDLTFYLQSAPVPEPATISLFIISMISMWGVRQMTR
ncbi:MAG: hypothetical protein WC959_01895 [Kiritimatiellales bacterium]